jgi:hypothetical protein
LAVGVWISGMPPGELRVVVEHVGDIPAEDNVAEAKPRLRRGQKLFGADVFSAQGAINVESTELYPLDVVLVEEGPDFGNWHQRPTQNSAGPNSSLALIG